MSVSELRIYENVINPVFIYVIGVIFLFLLFIIMILLLFLLLKRDYCYKKNKDRHKCQRLEDLCGKSSGSTADQ